MLAGPGLLVMERAKRANQSLYDFPPDILLLLLLLLLLFGRQLGMDREAGGRVLMETVQRYCHEEEELSIWGRSISKWGWFGW